MIPCCNMPGRIKLADYFADFTLECAEDAGHFVHFEVPELANAHMRAALTAT